MHGSNPIVETAIHPARLTRYAVPAIVAHSLAAVTAVSAWQSIAVPANLARFLWISLSIGQASVVCAVTAQWFAAARTTRSFYVAILACVLVFTGFGGNAILAIGYPFDFNLTFVFFLVLLPSLNASLGARILFHYIGYRFVRVESDEANIGRPSPSIPLRRFFILTAGLAALLGLVRATPAHLYDATAFVAIACAVSLSIIGIVAVFLVPSWMAFSEHPAVFRWGILAATICTFSTLVPLGYQLSWRWWAGFLFVIGYLIVLQYLTLLPFRYAGFRLRPRQSHHDHDSESPTVFQDH